MKNFLTAHLSLLLALGLAALTAAAPEAGADRGLTKYSFVPVDYPAEKTAAYASQLRHHQGVLATFTSSNFALLDAQVARNQADLPTRYAHARCRDYYRGLYARNEILIRAVYGYYDNYEAKDGKSSVYLGDVAEMKLLRDKFTAPCPNERSFACGFTGAGDRLQRVITGPDGRSRTVKLELISSSASPNDRDNRVEGDFNRASPAQRVKSDYAEAMFLNGFSAADVLVYLGHARAGGGPSFHPPVLKASTGQDPVDFNHYLQTRASFRNMSEALESSARPPKVLALFACRSAPLFADGQGPLARRMADLLADRGVSFVGTSGLTDSNTDLRNFVGLVDGLLGLRCGAGFKSGASVQLNGSRTDFVGPTP